MAKYCVSFDFRPSAMEFSTRHLALCNRVYLSGCSQFKPVEASLNWFDLVCSACNKIGIVWLVASLLLWTSTREVV